VGPAATDCARKTKQRALADVATGEQGSEDEQPGSDEEDRRRRSDEEQSEDEQAGEGEGEKAAGDGSHPEGA
jgi:hypothetical protein